MLLIVNCIRYGKGVCMVTADPLVDTLLLEAARQEFSEKTFAEASLRSICQKAGVTTGAFYNRYSNKEEIFEAVVATAVAKIDHLCKQIEARNYDSLDAGDMKRTWDATSQTQAQVINALYDDYDTFRILLSHAEGTRYSHFIEDLVTHITKRSMLFVDEVDARGVAPKGIDEEEFHMLATAYYGTLFEPLVRGYSRERALRHSEIVAKLFNWTDIFGF